MVAGADLIERPLARRAMAYVLAGGRGRRLMELTEKRAKPAVHFGGKVRIIDFALSNALNSGIRHIAVATQYKAHSLIRHLQRGWNFLRPERNESFDILPASQRLSEQLWYRGTADAVFQNIDIIPRLVKESKAVAHRFEYSSVRPKPDAPPYWRDVGTVDAFFDANIDLTREEPDLDLYDPHWPIWSDSEVTPPAKFVLDGGGYRGAAICSLVSGGCIVYGATVTNSLLFTRTRIQAGSQIDRSVILPYCEIGKNVRLRNVVIDRGVEIPDGLVIGEDPHIDAQRFRRTDSGVCLVTRP